MIIMNSISIIALLAMIVYVVCFLIRYKRIPQSLSVTAEFDGRYIWWQCTICSVMGWLSYWFPTVYSYEGYGFMPLLASAGIAGLALSGYFSYSPGEESRRTLTIHKVGSFTGAVLICLFYFFTSDICWIPLAVLSVFAIIGVFVKGYRYGYVDGNSIVFWEEIAIVCIIGYDIVTRFIESI